MKFGVVILNWNRYNETRQCILRLLDQVSPGSLDINFYLIDNDSGDGSGERLSKDFLGKVRYFKNSCNSGYTGGNNFGIGKALVDGCDFVLVLNNDLIVEGFDKLLTNVIELYNSDKSIAIVGFDVHDHVTKLPINQNGISDVLFNYLLKIDTSKMELVEKGIWYSHQRSVCGCAIAFRKSILNDIGLFDESFFMYAEEQDICLRAIAGGFGVLRLHNDDFRIYRSLDAHSADHLIWKYGPRNIMIAYRKSLSGFVGLAIISYQFSIALRHIFRFLLLGKPQTAFKVLKGSLLGLFADIDKVHHK